MTTTLSNVERTQELIEGSIDQTATAGLQINSELGGTRFQSMADVMQFSKLMAVSQEAVPKHCRNKPGVCLGITIQAIEWRMSPYAVASKSYVVKDQISYESQLIHAVIEQRAPIQGRLRHSYSGEGPSRRCKVWATPKGEIEPLEYESPEFKDIKPKNSPLWATKPDLQLFYNASRDWARMYYPDVIMGVYAEDELERSTVEGQLSTAEPRKALTSRSEHLKQRVTQPADPFDATAEPEENSASQHDSTSASTTGAAAGLPPTPDSLKDFVDAIHVANDQEAVDAAFQQYVSENMNLSEEEYSAACDVRDWRLSQFDSATPKNSGELFDRGANQYE